MVRGFLRGSAIYVALQTCAVVRGAVGLELLVRIMTRDAGEPRVALAPTFALFQAIGLRAGGGWARTARELHIPEGGVACTAKIHRVRGLELRGIENRRGSSIRYTGKLRGLLYRDVFGPWTVTSLAVYARRESGFVELPFEGRAGGVACETFHDFSRAHLAVHGFFFILGRSERATRREIQRLERCEVSDASFIKISIIFLE